MLCTYKYKCDFLKITSRMFIYNNICSTLLVMSTFIICTKQQLKDPVFTANTEKYLAECEKEIGIDADTVDKAWNENHFPNDQKLKCFFKCLNMKWGIIDASGDVVDDALKKVSDQYVNATTRDEIVAECGSIRGADLCETAMKLTACVKAAYLD